MDFSWITGDLLIGKTPLAEDYDRLRDLGVQLVISMRFEKRPVPDPHDPPLDLLWLRTFDNPILVIPIRKLMRGTRAALEAIGRGGKVYTHCAQGVHRSAVMGASILIGQGYSPEAAMALIKSRRATADPDIFYIRKLILRFARQWQAEQSP
jgi:protein-tyrosine phosphatase